jgi:hypothetical protein
MMGTATNPVDIRSILQLQSAREIRHGQKRRKAAPAAWTG